MGMFDSVWVNCPKCKTKVEFQSKAGPCRLKNYRIERVPVEIALSLDRTSEKCECGNRITLITDAVPIRVAMYIDEDENEDN